jgi:hypothetical protein
MSLFQLDTDTLSPLEQGHPLVLQRVNNQPVTDITVATLTVQEQMQGWQAALSRARNHQQYPFTGRG